MSQQYTDKVVRLRSACEDGIFGPNNYLTICHLAGILVGSLAIFLGSWFGYLSSGHQLNDPIYLALSINSVFRGFLYFNWSAFFTPLLFSIGIGIASGFTAKILASKYQRILFSRESGSAASLAAVLSAIPVLLVEVRGIQVLIMYALATWLSMVFARSIAKRITHK